MLAAGPSHAQSSRSPTDQQLTAAYCVGINQHVIASTRLMPFETPDEIVALHKEEAAKGGYPPLPDELDFEQARKFALDTARLNLQVRAWLQGVDTQRWRFIAYLMATGALRNPDSFQGLPGISAARDQGISDQKECESLADSRCSTSPQPLGTTEAQRKEELRHHGQCVNEIPVCMRKTRCAQLDPELPF
jgi:hypothetical protein